MTGTYKRWIAGILILFLCLGGLEVGMRLLEAPRPWEPDRSVGWKTAAGVREPYELLTQGGSPYRVEYVTDSQGARRYDTGAGETLSVLALGDSFTMDVFWGDEESWYGTVARGLAERYQRRVTVTAVGAPGYGTLQELLAAAPMVEQRPFDLLILQTCVNDFVDNTMPWSAAAKSRDAYYRRPYALAADPTKMTWVDGVAAWWYRGPAAQSRLWRKLDHAARSVEIRWALRGVAQTDHQRIRLEQMMPERPDFYEDAKAITTALVGQIRAMMPDQPAFLFTCWEGGSLPLNKMWPAIARDAGFVYVPRVPETVNAAGRSGEDVYAGDGVHWSPRGQTIAGQVILNRITDVLSETGLPRHGARSVPR